MFRKTLLCICSVSLILTLFCRCSNASKTPSAPTEAISPTEASTEAPSPLPETLITINSENFPDSTFRNYILDYCDEDGDRMLSETEISNVREIDVSNKGLETVSGIEYMTALETLNISGNQLLKINLSKNVNLKTLDCSRNNLGNLSLDTNIKLVHLNCSENPRIKELLLNNNTLLSYLDCSKNPNLSDLGISSLYTSLHVVNISETGLKSFPVNYMVNLTELYCSGAHVGSYIFPKNSMLSILVAERTGSCDISECSLLQKATFCFLQKNLSIENKSFLKSLSISYSEATEEIIIENCSHLEDLQISCEYSDKLHTIKAKNLPNLNKAQISLRWDSKIADVDLSGCKALRSLQITGAKRLNITGCSFLQRNNYYPMEVIGP